jgi:hypothetical protein
LQCASLCCRGLFKPQGTIYLFSFFLLVQLSFFLPLRVAVMIRRDVHARACCAPIVPFSCVRGADLKLESSLCAQLGTGKNTQTVHASRIRTEAYLIRCTCALYSILHSCTVGAFSFKNLMRFNLFFFNYLLSPKSRTYIFHRKTRYREEKIIVTVGFLSGIFSPDRDDF